LYVLCGVNFETDTLDLPLGRQLHVVSRLYFLALAERLRNLDIDRYFTVLTCIDQEGGPITQQEVGRRLLIDKTSMVKIIDYLSKYGYVERVINPDDRRSYHVRLTEKSKEELPKIYQAMDSLNKEAFSGLSKVQLHQFVKMLACVGANLQSRHSSKCKV